MIERGGHTVHPGGKLPYDRLLRNEGENVLEFAVLFQIGHDQIVHGHHRSILADIIPVGGSAAQDIACIVQLRIAQICVMTRIRHPLF